MNSEGHQSSARIVNGLIGGVFNEGRLLAGAVDPDTHDSGRNYTGIESKHHFDISGNGRFHTAADICQIVFSYIELARSNWKAGFKEEASFYFGVATHFYLDGFICSPSADEDAHSRGDRVFRNKAVKLERTGSGVVPVADQKSGSVQYVHELAERLQYHFGKTDPDDLPQALGVLAEMGRIVTDNAPYPPEFEEELKRILSQSRLEVAATCQRVQDKMKGDYRSFVEKRKELLRNSDNLFHYVNDILLDRRHRQTNRFSKLFDRRRTRHEPYYEIGSELQDASQDFRKAVSTVQGQTSELCDRIDSSAPTDGWYSDRDIDGCAAHYALSVRQVGQRAMDDIESFKNKVLRGYETAVRNQDRQAVGWFLDRYESKLWESPEEREKAESLSGDRTLRFLPWILTLPVGLIGSLLCLLSGVVCGLLALLITVLSGFLLSVILAPRLDLAYKWQALERLKQDIRNGLTENQENRRRTE